MKTVKKNSFNMIGSCSMDDIKSFNELSYDLKEIYGRKNVWFDRDYVNRLIIFLTH